MLQHSDSHNDSFWSIGVENKDSVSYMSEDSEVGEWLTDFLPEKIGDNSCGGLAMDQGLAFTDCTEKKVTEGVELYKQPLCEFGM